MVGSARLALLSSALMLGACGAPASQPVAEQAPATPAAPPPVMMMAMDVAPGTALELTLETPVSSETAKAEDVVRATVAKPVVVAGMTVIPAGAPATGTVVSVKERASVVIHFNQVTVADTPYTLKTAPIGAEKPGFSSGAALKTTIDEKTTINAPM